MGIPKECPAKLKRGRNFVQEGDIKEEKAKFQRRREGRRILGLQTLSFWEERVRGRECSWRTGEGAAASLKTHQWS